MNWNTVLGKWTNFKAEVTAEKHPANDGHLVGLADTVIGRDQNANYQCHYNERDGKKVRLVYWPTTKFVELESEEEFSSVSQAGDNAR